MEVRYQLRYSPEWVSPEGDCQTISIGPPRSPNRVGRRAHSPSAEAFHWVIRQPERPLIGVAPSSNIAQ